MVIVILARRRRDGRVASRRQGTGSADDRQPEM